MDMLEVCLRMLVPALNETFTWNSLDIPLFTVDIQTLTRQTLRWKLKKSLKSSNNLDIPKCHFGKVSIKLGSKLTFTIVLAYLLCSRTQQTNLIMVKVRE